MQVVIFWIQLVLLSPNSIEAQACLDDWTKAKFRQQEQEHEQTYEFFENEQTTGTEGSDD